MTKKFWCHYIGNDGNTPKRRSIELTDISELLPNVSNEGAKTPVWFLREEDVNYHQVRYRLYVQLSDKVAAYVDSFGETFLTYMQQSDTKNEVYKRDWEKLLSFIHAYQDYDSILLTGKRWIMISVLRAYQEVGSPIWPILDALRNKGLKEREEEERQEREKRKREAEEKARRKAEQAAKEEERLTGEADKCRKGESIAGPDVAALCRRYGIAVHLRTVHNLQQVIANINGKEGTCQYYRQRGQRKPFLDGCFKTAKELYEYLQTH